MTAPPVRPPLPPHLQPTAKAPSTARSTQLSALANSTPLSSRSSSRVRGVEARPSVSSPDYASETATLSLIRRVLAPDRGHGTDSRESPGPVEEFLPPLTSSNEIDTQLYAILAIVIKEFVYSWYAKITPDHVFVEEVIHIVAHCSRAVEQRVRRIDIPALLLDEIPAILERHVGAYQTTMRISATSAYGANASEIYHALNPHPAMSPVPDRMDEDTITKQQEHESAYRQLLVQGTLAVLLPTDDWENVSLRTFLGDLLADLILGQSVAGKLCEGWFVHVAISKAVEAARARMEPKAPGEELQHDTRGRLEKFGLLSSKDADHQHHSSTRHQSRPSALFWRAMQYAYLTVLLLRFIGVEMFHARYLPPRSQQARSSTSSPIVATAKETEAPAARNGADPPPRPVLGYRIVDTISTLLDLSTRMPWLASIFALVGHLLTAGAWSLGGTNSLWDKFLHNSLKHHVLTPSLIPPLLLHIRLSLFPANTLAPRSSTPPIPPSPQECLRLRRQAAQDLLSLIPRRVAEVYFAPRGATEQAREEEMLVSIEEGWLDCFGEGYMNRHLLYGVVEGVLGRVVPELLERREDEPGIEKGVK